MAAPEKLSIVVHSGDPARVHYALMMASAGIAIGRRATLFFTMEAIRTLEGEAPPATEELIRACAELGATFMVCEAGLRATRLTRDDLRQDLPMVECGIVTFLHDCAPAGQILFV